jgi:hypothetical protein
VRLAISAVFAAALLASLAGCKEGQPADLVAKVQEATRSVCGFVPIASTVAAVLDSIAGTGGTATVVAMAAKGICVAVGPKTTLFGFGEAQTMDNVKIEGCWADDPKCQPDGTIKE